MYSAPERDFETIENDNFHFKDYLNDLDREKEDQGINQDETLDDLGNSDETSDEDISISNNNQSETGSAERIIFDDEDNDEELMPNSEKAKWMLADNLLEAIELHFGSLRFQDMAQFYGMKNMGGLKQHHDFKRRYPVEAAEKIQKTRKIFAEQLKIRGHLTRKQWYWAMRLDNIQNPRNSLWSLGHW